MRDCDFPLYLKPRTHNSSVATELVEIFYHVQDDIFLTCCKSSTSVSYIVWNWIS